MEKEDLEMSDSARGHLYTTLFVLAFFGFLAMFSGPSDMTTEDYLIVGGLLWLIVRYFVFVSDIADK